MLNQFMKERRYSNVIHICDKGFSQKQDLNRHIESVHEGKKSFKCNICDAGFTHKANLNKHIDAVHKEKKKFKCTICDEVFFSQKQDLNRHIE